jgi:hypothetical protein
MSQVFGPFTPPYVAEWREDLLAVRASCEADLVPEWCIEMVIERVLQELKDCTWPRHNN